MSDTRLVQTAVLGEPNSTEPVYFPPEYEESLQFRHEHDGATFYCGHFLGGCGGELVTKISDLYDIVSHFAHHPDAPPCPHKSTHRAGSDAADHLYIHNGLIYLGTRSGRRLTATIDMHAGRCQHILLRDSDDLAVRVQFADLPTTEWTDADRRLADTFDTVQWIAGSEADTAAKLLRNRDGYALRSRCQLRGRTREVLVRMDGDASETDWIPLADCAIDANGIVTSPALAQQRELHHTAHLTAPVFAPAAAALSDSELAELMRPLVNELISSMNQGDRPHARSLLLRYREELVMVQKSDLARMKSDLTAIKRWVSGGPAAPLTPTQPMVPAPPRASEHAQPDPRRRTKKATTTELTTGQILHLTGVVADLERAHAQENVDEIRALLLRHNKRLRALKTAPEVEELNKRVQTVRLWFISNQRIGTPVTPTAPTRPARTFPDRLTVELEALLRTAAAEQRTLSSPDILTQLTITAAELVQYLHTIARADLNDRSPLLAALIVDPHSEPGLLFQNVVEPLDCARTLNNWGWEMVRLRELERAHGYYSPTRQHVPRSLLRRR